MANSFPSVPTDYALKSVVYLVDFDGPVGGGIPLGSSFTFSGGESTTVGALAALGGTGGLGFIFDTPGAFGTFDQSSIEASIAAVLGNVFQLVSTLTDDSITDIELGVSVTRTWTWSDAAGNTATYTDAMPLS